MEKVIEQVQFSPRLPRLTRVAAYARVSSGKDMMLHSLSAQVSYYSDLIQRHAGWRFAGVFSDEAVTGTKEDRAGFQKLLTACRDGQIDLILTKSISRFARNTVTLLETVRELKKLGVDVFFEEQNLHTLSVAGELMLTVLASFAQAESESFSENMKWRVRRQFESGKPWNVILLGYRYQDGVLTVVPEEADIVRRIFAEYLSGKGAESIAAGLNRDGLQTMHEKRWSRIGVLRILRNVSYTGNLLLQKTCREDCLTKRKSINLSRLPQYYAEGSHEAIVSTEDFAAVQREIELRSGKYVPNAENCAARYPFSGKIVCGCCGKHYRRKTTKTGPVWICSTFNSLGKAACLSKQIPESALISKAEEVLGSLDAPDARIAEIVAEPGNCLRFRFHEGTEQTVFWKDRSRAESWTEEKRAAARAKAQQQRE